MTSKDTPKIIDFQTEALGRLRAKVSALGEENAVLLSYARGHAGAISQVHNACLAALEATGFEHLVHIITQDWVDMLGLDAVALVLETSQETLHFGGMGIHILDSSALDKDMPGPTGVILRCVPEGASLFGPAASLIRSEALIRLPLPEPLPRGILALGSRMEHNFEGVPGSELLTFLGAVAARTLGLWLTRKP